MKETRIALRYAKALFDLAVEQDFLEHAGNDMKLVWNICNSNKDFRLMLSNPIIKSDKKQAIISEIFEKKAHKISLAFLLIIIRKHREVFFEGIAEQFINIYKEYKGIETAILKTATEIGEDTRKKITELLKIHTNSKIELVEEVKKDLIGGFTLSFDNKQYDASILNEIKKLSKEFGVNI